MPLSPCAAVLLCPLGIGDDDLTAPAGCGARRKVGGELEGEVEDVIESVQITLGVMLEKVSAIYHFAQSAMKVADRLIYLRLGVVNNAEHILEKTGFDLTGFERILDNYGVRHTIKQHGNPIREAKRGQIAVELHDFERIEAITSNPDKVFHDGKNKVGRDVLVYTKLIDGIGYWYAEEIRSSKQLVATDSIRKKQGEWLVKS